MNTDETKGMEKTGVLNTAELLIKKEKEILGTWIENQMANITLRADLISKEALEKESLDFLRAFVKAISGDNLENIEAWSINRLSGCWRMFPGVAPLKDSRPRKQPLISFH